MGRRSLRIAEDIAPALATDHKGRQNVRTDTDSIGENFPLRLPSPQERADALLMRWRLGRSLGLPPYLRLDLEDSSQ